MRFNAALINTTGNYPALPFQKALLQFAAKEGMRIWTAKERMKVISRYEIFAANKN